MLLDTQSARQHLKSFDFKRLFVEELGWDNLTIRPILIEAGDDTFTLSPVAHKRGVQIFVCSPYANGKMPPYATRQKIERQLTKLAREHLIIFVDGGQAEQRWQWVAREPGKPAAYHEQPFRREQSGEALIQQLNNIVFPLSAEEGLTISGVTVRLRDAFDKERVTRRFYDTFKNEHSAFLKFIDGITDQGDREWYASLMLNRLMFIYFIQKKGFLDGDTNYLQHKLAQVRAQGGDGRFHTFYRRFLLRLFHEGLGGQARPSDLDKLIGNVPYLNGGLFDVHELERDNPAIEIPDEAFERIFRFFDSYQWHLDDRPLRADNEINPDVLGYIFEKYINQKQMGAYYTKEDITEYISKNTIIPFLFDEANQKCRIAFEGEQSVWRLLQSDPDRYIYGAVRKGVERELSPDIAAGIGDVSQRTGWNRPASEEYALPTEIWREVVARRQRYQEVWEKMVGGEIRDVNDLITYNLNIWQFAQDVIQTSEGPELLRAFWQAIQRVTVLDPTCGSGAFLFAALRILEPLYKACLDRMQVFVDELDHSPEPHRPEKYADFRKVLAQVEVHNRNYYVLKQIILNNLYGVDIMEEAVEICKLRLFLKLVAQVGSAEQIEPLPDIDFNIRAGNTLVGFATEEEVDRAFTTTMTFDDSRERFKESAEICARAYARFREMQTEQDMDSAAFTSAKAELRRRLDALNDELDLYLARQYGVDPANTAAFEKWRESHQPFHWFVEFYDIMQRGGFDVVIGNPPYVEYSKVSKLYTIRNYNTDACGNLYAAVIERSITLTTTDISHFGLIVPLSVCAGERFDQLRTLIRQHITPLWVSNYEIFPSKLFDGAFQRLSILIGARAESNVSQRFATKIQRWYSAERPHLITGITYTHAEDILEPLYFAKLGSPLHEPALAKIKSKTKGYRVARFQSPRQSPHSVYYQEATNYWMKATCKLPYYKKNGLVTTPAHGRFLYLDTPQHARAMVAVMNSSLFYLWFAMYSDGFHLSHTLVTNFYIDNDLLSSPTLAELGTLLEEDIARNAVGATRNTKSGDHIEIEEYRMSASKFLLDKIDRVLAQHYGFTDEELDFIINYDIKYRMGRDAEEGDDEEESPAKSKSSKSAQPAVHPLSTGPAAYTAPVPPSVTQRAADPTPTPTVAIFQPPPSQLTLEPAPRQTVLADMSQPAPFRVGERVTHAVFGEGQVLSVTPSGDDHTVTVLFQRVGKKTLSAKAGKLEKS